MIHIKGELYDDGDSVAISGKYGSLAENIAKAITENLKEHELSKVDIKEDKMQVEASVFIPKVSFRAYFSDNECSLEEAENNQILLSIGAMDIFQEWYGYSEWTIMGYDVENFKLISEDGGEHDLEQIFRSYIGKYVHIAIEIM